MASRPLVAVVANDQEWSLRSIETILAARGFTVERAYTGREAIDLALAVRPDVVILDWRMPELTGVEACRQLRADPRVGHTTPIVITTAGTPGRAERIQAYAAGAWELCVEPLDGESFLLKLQTYVEAKLATDRLRAAIPAYRP